ncbi:nodal modulator 3 [Marmota monax]|uniref:Nodal modulator 3 n=2 Tax=Marmota monax TaxID=9995 RepID=A0A834QRL0_MARMO|nr:nodal modulator 3 [Marmota monax]
MWAGRGAGPPGPVGVAAAVLLLLLLCGVGPACGSEDIVVGCGGFVKSDVEINYSLIEIKLYTKHGTLKYQTDCAPNNGYFMIPLYDKGDFILKIEPPLGWSFEPTNVELYVDGVSDICTKGGDINFVFTGFSVNGKVLSKGQPLGPAGVQVSLRNTGTEAKIQSTVTQPGGKFAFFKVLPGDYEILATHPTWPLKEASTTVRVTNSNANAAGPLIVAGYNVSGSVRSDGEPMKGVKFLLFSSFVTKEDVLGCNVSPVPGFQPQDESLVYLCHTVSKEDGSFSFYSLPSGGYTVVPFYRGERITFDVAPSRLDFTVEHDSLKIEPMFHVMGFSVTGRVLNGPEGEGVPDAVVTLNNQIKVRTKADGSFRLENITTGTYTIHAHKEHLYFQTLTIKIAPNTPQLADIVATRFSVCGQISIIRFPDASKQMGKYKVVLSSQDKDKSLVTVETDAHGSFCFKAKPGTYKVQVVVPEAETRAGLMLKPHTFPLTVTDSPVMDVAFVQFLASVSGKVSCLDTCGDLLVTLQSLSRQGEKRSLQLSGKVNSMTFTFDNVLPGKYKISIVHEDWCWRNKSLEVEVLEEDVSAVEFRQTGYMLRCALSHAITLEFYQDGNGPENVGIYNLSKGVNRFCLSKPGVYKVTPRSCHRFEQAFYTYDTSSPSILTLTAIRHHVLGTITTDKMMDVTVTIKSSIDSEPALVLGPLKSAQELRREQQLAEIETRRQEREKNGKAEGGEGRARPPGQELVDELQGPFHYDFSYWARSGEKITVTPSSKELLFYPPAMEALVSGESCPGKLIEIHGKAGLFLEGQIHPELEGVEIVISEKGASSPLITVFTDDKGAYSVGPLHSDLEYTVTSQKEGYVLTAVEGTIGDFKAYALAGVSFEIRAEDDQPLPGVLLSLSGGVFRSNLLTQDNGVLTFSSLSPGQYYFKPMMKEFRFEPSSQMIEVQEGQNLKITITGYRTAYSCYGTVTSLNGEPEQGVAVEAVGQKDCSMYGEDTVTDEEGKFRLRGLLLIPLLWQLTSRLQGVRALGQAASDNSGPEDSCTSFAGSVPASVASGRRAKVPSGLSYAWTPLCTETLLKPWPPAPPPGASFRRRTREQGAQGRQCVCARQTRCLALSTARVRGHLLYREEVTVRRSPRPSGADWVLPGECRGRAVPGVLEPWIQPGQRCARGRGCGEPRAQSRGEAPAGPVTLPVGTGARSAMAEAQMKSRIVSWVPPQVQRLSSEGPRLWGGTHGLCFCLGLGTWVFVVLPGHHTVAAFSTAGWVTSVPKSTCGISQAIGKPGFCLSPAACHPLLSWDSSDLVDSQHRLLEGLSRDTGTLARSQHTFSALGVSHRGSRSCSSVGSPDVNGCGPHLTATTWKTPSVTAQPGSSQVLYHRIHKRGIWGRPAARWEMLCGPTIRLGRVSASLSGFDQRGHCFSCSGPRQFIWPQVGSGSWPPFSWL